MSSYIGAVDVNGEQVLIGSTLYGICSTTADTPAKRIVLSSFDALIQGVTVHIKFISGNTINSNVTLEFFPDDNNSSTHLTAEVAVVGNCFCEANGVLAFTYEEIGNNKYWRVNNAVNVTEGNVDGAINVNGQTVNIHGLGSAAYTNSGAYATSDHTHSQYAPINNPTFTGTVTLPGAPSTSNEAATKQYVDTKTQGLDGLSSAMIFKGVLDSTEGNVVTNGGNESPYINGTQLTSKTAGDVVLYGQQEYVWNGSSWQLFGDEGSYALKTSTGTASKVNSFTANTLPTLTVTPTDTSLVTVTDGNNAAALTTTTYTVPNVTQAGTTMTASVAQGILTLTPGSNTVLGTDFTIKGVDEFTPQKLPNVSVTNVSVGSASGWNAGSQASLSKDDLTVVVPNNANNP